MMHLADLRGRERIAVAESQMIVMRADDNPLGFELRIASFDRTDHVADGLLRADDLGGDPRLRAGKLERLRHEVLADLLLDRAEVLAGGLERFHHRRALRVHRRNPHVAFFLLARRCAQLVSAQS